MPDGSQARAGAWPAPGGATLGLTPHARFGRGPAKVLGSRWARAGGDVVDRRVVGFGGQVVDELLGEAGADRDAVRPESAVEAVVPTTLAEAATVRVNARPGTTTTSSSAGSTSPGITRARAIHLWCVHGDRVVSGTTGTTRLCPVPWQVLRTTSSL